MHALESSLVFSKTRNVVLVDTDQTSSPTGSVVAKEEVDALQNQPSTYSTRQELALAADFGPVHRAYR
jgi:hypothetical protein